MRSALGGRWVVLSSPRFRLPFTQPRLAPNIHCSRYLDTMAELRRYAACFHLLEDAPRTLVVDDISDFLDSRHALAKPAFYILSLTSQTARW